MKMKSFIKKVAIAGIVLFVVFSASWSQEFDYAAYTQTTLRDVITEEQNHAPDQAEAQKYADCIQLECTVTKYRVPCGYSNIRRLISAKKKNVIRLWMETLDIDPKLASLYQQEIRVTEGSRGHWIPIQEQLFSHLNRELAKDDAIELFILFIGKVGSEFVFIATEFEKPIPSAHNSIQTTAFTRAAP